MPRRPVTPPLVALVAAWAFLSGAPAGAVDGAYLITQSRANAGNITPGDAPGFPVTISRSGSYSLATNLEVPASLNGIVVTATEVTIDLNGFRISGGGVATTGVVGHQRSLTLRNGTIRAFRSQGIEAQGALLIVEDMRISENRGQGIRITSNGSARILNSTIFGSGFSGIGCYQSCHIEGNMISTNGAGAPPSALDLTAGLYIRSGMVLGNTIIGNFGHGILASANSSDGTGYGNNTITNNKSGAQIFGNLIKLFPNACVPAC